MGIVAACDLPSECKSVGEAIESGHDVECGANEIRLRLDKARTVPPPPKKKAEGT